MSGRRSLPLDALVVPGLLALIAHDLFLFDPIRVIAWRWLHDERLALALPRFLRVLAPAPLPGWDRDPVAAVLALLMLSIGFAYFALGRAGAPPRWRALLIPLAAALLVVLPTLALIEMGRITQRPYGQDGGVVQLPLAMDKLMAGQSPYGADYSDSILGKEARASGFWAQFGENPILHHHAYLPGTHVLMAPWYLLGRATGAPFDPRVVTLLAFILAVFAAAMIPRDLPSRLAATACVALNPLIYWHQVFGANDVLVLALLLGAVALGGQGRRVGAAMALGLACATKQLAWPFAPFLILSLAEVDSIVQLRSPAGRARLLRILAYAGGVFIAVVAPVVALDPGAFWMDVFGYNVGLRGAGSYPLGGTPGFGFANFLIYFGVVSSLTDYFPFGIFYLLFIPLGLFLVTRQWRNNVPAAALVWGSAALLASIYFSRVAHPNYLVLVAGALPIGVLAGRRFTADTAVVPLALLATAVAIIGGQVYETSWGDAVASRLPQWTTGAVGVLLPRAGPKLTLDPIGLGVAALAAGAALVYLVAAASGLPRRILLAIIGAASLAVVVLPTLLLERTARASGIVRAEYGWTASVAARDTTTREAWSRSFQRDPPGEMLASGEDPAATGSVFDAWLRSAARVMRSSPVVDSRPMLLAALALGVVFLVRATPPAQQPLVLGFALLAPFTSLGVPFGSGEWLVIAAVLLTLFVVPPRIAPLLLVAGFLHQVQQLPQARPETGFAALYAYRARADWQTVTLVLATALMSAVGLLAAFGSIWVWFRPAAWARPRVVTLTAAVLSLAALAAPGATPMYAFAPLLLLLVHYASPPSAGVVELADTHV